MKCHENKMQSSYSKIEKSKHYILQLLMENYFDVCFYVPFVSWWYCNMTDLGRTCHILEYQRQYVPLASHDNETTVL